ncbi:MAG: efflux RND transporter permease subunit [Bacteroidales bacterium]
MEKMVALPVEDAMNELEEIKTISSDIRDGIAVVSVEFDFESDADEKFDEVVQQVNALRSRLPDQILSLETWQWSISDMAMMQWALVSEAPYRDLRIQAEALADRLEKIRSVRQVEVHGLPEEEVQIALDFEKMALVHTSIDQISRALASNNANIPGGDVDLGGSNLSVKSSGAYRSLEEIRNTVVQSHEGRLIRLSDVARVDYGYAKNNYLTRFGSPGAKRAIFIGISQKEGLNVLQTANAIGPVIEEFRSELPSGMALELVYNQPATVKARIDGFLRNLVQGIVLVGLLIFFSLGIRSSLVVVLAIPLSLVIGLGFVDRAGFGLQQITIGGLVVALGMLVDNSIVVVENINRYMRLGHNREEASILATSEIGWPVVTATLTTILAFVPIAAMPDKAGEFIKSLPLTIAFTLTVSLLIALTFTPVVASRLFRDRDPREQRIFGLSKILQWLIDRPFRKSLAAALRRPWITLVSALAIFGGSAALFPLVGVSFFPKAEQPNLMIQASLPEGASLERTDRVARYMEGAGCPAGGGPLCHQCGAGQSAHLLQCVSKEE